jgi:putative oxidoreductase
MKIAGIVIRVLMGLLFLFASVTYLFKMFTPPPVTGDMKVFNDGLVASGYIMNVVKVIELLCAIAFLSGRFVALATVVIFPIMINILLVHVFLAPEGLPVAIPLFLFNLFLAWHYRKNYEGLLSAKRIG